VIIKPSSCREPESRSRLGALWQRNRRLAMYVAILGVTFVTGTKFQSLPWLIRHRVKTAVAVAPDYLSAGATYLNARIHAKPVPVISLDIKFKHIAKLKVQRTRALEDGWIRTTDDDFVPATLNYEDRSVRVKIRLKGDRVKHVAGDKWSFRVKVQGEARPFGMRTFSLHHPEMRGYLHEWAFLEDMRRQGILAVRYQFVRVMINGDDKGIYALEEHFSKELLESQGRREGVIVAFEERPSVHYDIWKRVYRGKVMPDVATRLTAVESQDIRTFDTKRTERLPALRAQADEAVEMLRAFQEGRRKASEVFDVELMGRFYALVDLWIAGHQLLWQNSRFYYNPITARLEPIAFDAMGLGGFSEGALAATETNDASINGPLRDPEIARVYLRELRRISGASYLEEARAVIEPEFLRWQLALQTEWPMGTDLAARFRHEVQNIRKPVSKIALPWDKLAARQEFIRSSIEPRTMIIASAVRPSAIASSSSSTQVPAGEPADTYVVDVRSVGLLPVEVVGFRVAGGSTLSAATVWCKRNQAGVWESADGAVSIVPGEIPYDENNCPIIATFRIPALMIGVSGAESGQLDSKDENGGLPTIEVLSRFPGQSYVCTTSVRWRPDRVARGSAPIVPTVGAALERYPFLECTSSGDALRIRRGVWNVAGDLVLPKGMVTSVEAGTTLRFKKEAVLYTPGSLHLHGDEGEPIVLEPQDDGWAGVVVTEASERSDWQHVVVRKTSGVERGGWMLTGGVTFYRSDVTLQSVCFEDSRSEDALNIVHADGQLVDCVFRRCGSDAFDGDFITGQVIGCQFEDVKGDGLDVSGSEVSIEHLTARSVADKVLSAGEGSTVRAVGIEVEQVGIAAASKDSSQLELTKVAIRNARIGLTAYQKKEVFGPARLVAKRVMMWETPQATLAQEGSSVWLNDILQECQALDVNALYASGTLGN